MSDAHSLRCPLRPAVLAIAAILLAAGCSECDPEGEEDYVFDDVQRAHIESGVEFPPLKIDTNRLEASRDEFYKAPDPQRLEEVSDVDVDRFKDAFRTLNEAQFRGDDIPPEVDLQEASADYRHQIRTMITPLGKRAFVPVGEPLFAQCNQGLSRLLDAVRDEELSLTKAIEDPPADRFQDYRQNCGNLLAYLKKRNLIDSDGQWTRDDAAELVDIRQRYRWIDEVRQYYPTQKLMSPYELKVFYRWRVEDDEAYSLQSRRDYLRTARTLMPDFYGPLAQARLDAVEMDEDQVLSRFRQLRDDHPFEEVDGDEGAVPPQAIYQAIYEEMAK